MRNRGRWASSTCRDAPQRPALASFPDSAQAREFGVFDDEAIAAVDKFRSDHAMTYQGNAPGLVDARLIEALRAAYFKKR